MSGELERLVVKVEALKSDRLRLSDMLVDSAVERRLDHIVGRALVEATTPDGGRCVACGLKTGHKDDCVWQAAYDRFVTG
jgi:hypothetical protein